MTQTKEFTFTPEANHPFDIYYPRYTALEGMCSVVRSATSNGMADMHDSALAQLMEGMEILIHQMHQAVEYMNDQNMRMSAEITQLQDKIKRTPPAYCEDFKEAKDCLRKATDHLGLMQGDIHTSSMTNDDAKHLNHIREAAIKYISAAETLMIRNDAFPKDAEAIKAKASQYNDVIWSRRHRSTDREPAANTQAA